MDNKIDYSWLQISDLHIFDGTDWNIMSEAYKKILDKVNIGFVIVTGDLHQYAQDYNKSHEFLCKLSEMLKLDRKNFFIVPGNHDSYTCNDKEAYTFFIENNVEKQQDCYRNYFIKGKLVDCFLEYNKFISAFYNGIVPIQYEEPEQVVVKNWKNKLNIIHINTAINCNGNNSLKQIVDIYKLSNLYTALNNNCPSIIIAHHPIDLLHDSHKTTVIRYISDWRVSAYLCGDVHKEMIFHINTFLNSNSSIPCIVCGKSSCDNQDVYSDFGCIIYSKYKNSSRVDVAPYVWNTQAKRFDQYMGFNTDNGRYSFDLISPNHVKDVDSTEMLNKVDESDNIPNETIWLPDAESATGKQTRFSNFTHTKIVNSFINSESGYWGLSAVKGIGKTFVLQIKRTKSTQQKLCLPVGITPSQNNGWGTDSIDINDGEYIVNLKTFNNMVLLWKYSIITYTINQLINYENNSTEINSVIDELKKLLLEYKKDKKVFQQTYDYCTNPNYSCLDKFIKSVLLDGKWMTYVKNDVVTLSLFQKKIEIILQSINKTSVVILIDKVDQALRQTSAEPPASCEECKKANVVNECNYYEKNLDFCTRDTTLCKNLCCFGCEKYGSKYSDRNYRIHDADNVKYKHVNIWQYFQLALIKAAFDVKNDFKGIIEIYFTIRQEAYACEANLLGENNQKIVKIVQELWYSKEEQRAIFYDCIRHQNPKLLLYPELLSNENQIEEAFLGVKGLCHPYAKNLSESVFDSIYRHSFDRTRDIQKYGEMLTNHLEDIKMCDTALSRAEKVKELIEDMAADLAFKMNTANMSANECYYLEKMDLLPNFWSDPDNFKKLILCFKKNLMMCKEVRMICKKFNQISSCIKNCEKCVAAHHPFSMLYKLGMLGQIRNTENRNNEITQKFLHSKDISYITRNNFININENAIYILHPALTKSIEHLNHNIKHFKGFILGKEIKVPKPMVDSLLNDFRKMNVKEFDDKYFYSKL